MGREMHVVPVVIAEAYGRTMFLVASSSMRR